MLNEGHVFRNQEHIKPMACDLESVLTAMKNMALAESDYADDLWNDLFAEDFETATTDSRIEYLVNFLYTIGKIEDNIPVDGTEYISAAGKDFLGYQVWDDDIPYFGFTVRSDDTLIDVYKLLYFDGNKVKVFTPFNGNAVNILSRTAIGDEHLTKIHFAKVLKTDLAKEIYGETLTPEQIQDKEVYAKRYLEHFLEKKITTEFNRTQVELDMVAIDKEIWSAIDK